MANGNQSAKIIEATRLEARALIEPQLQARTSAWMDHKECQGLPLDVMFPSDAKGVNAAKAICATCVVKEECLEYALSKREDFGVWGGMSERERRKIVKARKEAAKQAAASKSAEEVLEVSE